MNHGTIPQHLVPYIVWKGKSRLKGKRYATKHEARNAVRKMIRRDWPLGERTSDVSAYRKFGYRIMRTAS